MENNIIKQISETLLERGISNFEAGKKAGISRTTVGRIFSGESSPSLENIEALAKVAGFSVILKKTKK
ncbi:MAG: hypothetical protein BGO40_02870 [Chryseobacterium sp. 39-10]|nr:helix-turn-helix transcriptional regulator [Chryseobacterium sp.]OJV46521.1 MAG: hypothetical protein BGO40_02870 [Chryseobacterium sp. 39-10]